KLMEELIPFEKLPSDLKTFAFEYIEFRRELSKESDRGCAMLAASHIDYMLELLLTRIMAGNKSHHEQLFSFNGPFGTFSSKILVCYSLGLISSDALTDIQIIRKIRNEFG